MADNNFQDFGRQVSDAVQSALVSGDFSSIKNIVNSTLNTVLTKTISASKPFVGTPPRYGAPPPPHYGAPPPPRYGSPPPYTPPYAPPPPHAQKAQRGQRVNTAPPYYNVPPVQTTAIAKRKKVHYSGAGGVVLMVFGILGMLLTGTASLIATVIAIASGGGVVAGMGGREMLNAFITIAATLPLFIASTVATVRGSIICGRVKRYKNYWRILEGKAMCELDKLASSVQKPLAFVKKEIRKMLDAGMFPQGHLDEGQNTLMLGDGTYQQYLKEQQEKKESEQQRAEKKKVDEEQDPNSPAAVISEGRACIKQIREANDALAGEDISEKLLRLEQVTTKIFIHVEQYPEKLPEIRRFMSYYLPTTIKLVTSYQSFEAQPIQGDNITTAKGEILEMLGTINAAFETLLDSLFEDDAMDISTDISALKSMLAQEGLTGHEFKKEE